MLYWLQRWTLGRFESTKSYAIGNRGNLAPPELLVILIAHFLAPGLEFPLLILVLIIPLYVVQARERTVEGGLKSSQASAQGIAKMLVDQARVKRTKDNTSVVIIDFASKLSRSSFHTL